MKKYISHLNDRKAGLFILLLLVLVAGYGFYYFRFYASMPQATIFFLNDVPVPASNQKVLVFSPHPDDESIGAGGYISEARHNGAEVKIVLVTNGNKRHLETERYAEFKKATGIEGVPESDLVFLGYPDGQLQKVNEAELAKRLETEIDSYNPTIVIYPNMRDLHPDHAVVGRVVSAIMKKKPENILTYEYLVHYQLFPQPKKFDTSLYLLPPVNLIQFDKEWQRFSLTPEAEDDKAAAVYSYKTQLRVPFLRSLMLSSVRRNELFSVGSQQ